MNLPACHSRRLLAGERNVFFCAHPRLHALHDIVTTAVCKSCCLPTDPPPNRFRSLTACPDHLRQRSDLQLVIARYRENVQWRYQFHGLSTTVYDKGDARAENPLPNIGREAHTYLHHIVTHYDRLAPITVFLQGNPHAHVRNLCEKIWNLPADPGFQDLCDHVLVEDRHGEPIQRGLPLERCTRRYLANRPRISLSVMGPRVSPSRGRMYCAVREPFTNARWSWWSIVRWAPGRSSGCGSASSKRGW